MSMKHALNKRLQASVLHLFLERVGNRKSPDISHINPTLNFTKYVFKMPIYRCTCVKPLNIENKTGTRQCTWAVWSTLPYISVHMFMA